MHVLEKNFAPLDSCPAPKLFIPELKAIKHDLGVPESTALYQSIFRGVEVREMLAQFGKHDQQYLYEHQGSQGIGPANPPGHSTHELYSDGVAYSEYADGHRLPYFWMCGLDVLDEYVERYMAAARKRGWIVTITYPSQGGSEHHHLNFRHLPVLFNPIESGDHGPRVHKLTARLSFVRPPHDAHPYLDGDRDAFGTHVEAAVRHFQKDHHQHVDGVVGPHTANQLAVTFRSQWKRRHHDERHGQHHS